MSDVENQWWQTDTNDEVATKRELWGPLADAVGGFDLDPAAGCEPTPIADDRYTKSDDGLSKPWYGTVWLNPPFSEKTPWYRKLVDEYWNGDVEAAVALATVDPSADWFHEWFSTADLICYLDGRDWYHAGDSPSFSTQVGAWNPTDDLRAKLSTFGTLAEPVHEKPDSTLSEFGGGSE